MEATGITHLFPIYIYDDLVKSQCRLSRYENTTTEFVMGEIRTKESPGIERILGVGRRLEYIQTSPIQHRTHCRSAALQPRVLMRRLRSWILPCLERVPGTALLVMTIDHSESVAER